MRSSWAALAMALGAGPRGSADAYVLLMPGSERGYYERYGIVWQNVSSFSLDDSVVRWPLPEDPYAIDQEGLAGGITWAVEASLCDELHGQFPERVWGDMFLDCDDIIKAIAAGMRTWSVNHRLINFKDVSAECRQWEADGGDGKCPHAELWITAVGEEVGADVAAKVIHDYKEVTLFPRSTAGVELDRAPGILRADLEISSETCWYLDTAFCYGINRHKGGDLLLTVRIVFIILYLISGAYFIVLTIFLGIAWRRPDVGPGKQWNRLHKDVRTECQQATRSAGAAGADVSLAVNRRSSHDTDDGAVVVESHGERLSRERNPRRASVMRECGVVASLPLLIALFIMVFCPVFYYYIFLPCWECYDFQATMAHEIGHVLGFGHTDAELSEQTYLRATSPMGNSTCREPLMHVELVTSEASDDERERSIMYSMAKHRDLTKLTSDDLQGLQSLYPTCYTPTDEIKHVDESVKTGWLRLGVAVSVPYLIASIIILSIQWCVLRSLQSQLRRVRMAYIREQARRIRDRAVHNLQLVQAGALERARSFTSTGPPSQRSQRASGPSLLDKMRGFSFTLGGPPPPPATDFATAGGPPPLSGGPHILRDAADMESPRVSAPQYDRHQVGLTSI